MLATIIDGKSIADAVVANVREQVAALSVPLHLVAVCVSDDPALKSFVKLKEKAAQAAGMTFSSYFLDSVDEVVNTLDYLANDDAVDGIFVELPLPKGWDTRKVLSHIPLLKDVDVISPDGEKNFYANANDVLPPAVKALEYALSECDLDLTQAMAAVVGRGQLVGRPIAHWLERQGSKVLSIDIDTPNPKKITAQADIVIVGAGSSGLVSSDWIKEGAIIIDYGYARNAQGAIVGDVDYLAVSKKASYITPVPGGMGPLVIAAVLENLVALASK